MIDKDPHLRDPGIYVDMRRANATLGSFVYRFRPVQGAIWTSNYKDEDEGRVALNPYSCYTFRCDRRSLVQHFLCQRKVRTPKGSMPRESEGIRGTSSE